MGQVYKAGYIRLGRPVGIKVLSERLGRDDDARRHFEREAKANSRLNHPHICTLYDIGHHEAIDYLVVGVPGGRNCPGATRSRLLFDPGCGAARHAHRRGAGGDVLERRLRGLGAKSNILARRLP
jgi:hypothetical protein